MNACSIICKAPCIPSDEAGCAIVLWSWSKTDAGRKLERHVEGIEAATIANLMPHNAEEAKTLVHSLQVMYKRHASLQQVWVEHTSSMCNMRSVVSRQIVSMVHRAALHSIG